MASSNEGGYRNRPDILVGQLPDDFLRIDANNTDHQIENDQELAASLQHQYDQQAARSSQWISQFQAQLILTFVESKLVKNYGLINMNPYIRLRVGHTIYETKTCNKGGKNPKWNETFKCYLPYGVDCLHIEIYDECLITSDDLIAWATFKIPEKYLNNLNKEQTFQENILLNGKQGDLKEGEISFVCTVKPITASNFSTNTVITAPVYRASPSPYIFSGTSLLTQPIIVHQSTVPVSQLQAPNQVKNSDEDFKSLQEMFPKIELDVIKSVLVSERGNIDRAINNLLELNSTTE